MESLIGKLFPSFLMKNWKIEYKKSTFRKVLFNFGSSIVAKRLNVTKRYSNTKKLRINPTKVIIILYSNYNMKMNYNQWVNLVFNIL